MIREAVTDDIVSMQSIRNSVVENALSNPLLVPYEAYIEFLNKGRGWVYVDDTIKGFAIADIQNKNIWALFVAPGFEKKGIGRQLHDTMMDWYFKHNEDVWLSTSPNTRAYRFYKKAGWVENGTYGKGEIKFTLNRDEWKAKSKNLN